ncbi:MAG: hypothetical protein JO048_03705 [Methylobacteriaceae bacterium]|nr:hypothetical protein [Methylobacteriaceae bacterium]
MRTIKRFGMDRRGAVAPIFGLMLLPLIGLAGAAVDYGRAADTQAALMRAIDATALLLVKQPRTTDAGTLNRIAQRAFPGFLETKFAAELSSVTVTRTDRDVTVSAAGRVPNAFMQLFRKPETPIAATATAAWSETRIEIALVLDNTGSMADLIGGQRKIDALKRAATDLISDLQTYATDTNAVRVSIVPFDTEVRIDPNLYRNASWIDWASLTGGATAATWTGYLVDRPQPYNIQNDAPVLAIRPTLYPPLPNGGSAYGGLTIASVRPMTSLATSALDVKAAIQSMQPRGNTNISLGMSWGTATLTGSVPLGGPSVNDTRTLKRFIVLLTDGDNTAGWRNGAPTSNVGYLDSQTQLACQTARANAEVFTIRLLAGNVNLLRGCASKPENYFDVQNGGQLTNAFKSILNAITGTRLTN